MKKQQTIPSSFDSFIIEFEDVNYKIHKCNLDKYSNSYLATKYEKDLVINLDLINSSRFYYYDFIENGILDIANMSKIMLVKLGLYEYIKHIYYFKNNFVEKYVQGDYMKMI